MSAGMAFDAASDPCEWARRHAALVPDGELVAVELHRLGEHLSTCAACEGFARRVAAITSMIRSQPLQPREPVAQASAAAAPTMS